ncbi:MAG: glucose-6-phosphate dehydrogenase assembly protein OpcA [Propioniciclava sp.]|uniref:glucose-6-phosphate dehydrogenase assembly protein OpcA n=1 Tax=Propioniciclava sp. TaxID=2038686 RepID=UPI0039E55700
MITTLKGTTARDIQNAITHARQSVGVASGLVFTLIVVAPASDYDEVFDACVEAGREHPSRIIVVTDGSARATRLDAELHVGDEVPGEIVALRFHGELREHKDSTLLPLLLSDSPVIAWWPREAPEPVASDPIGALAGRRVTDAMGCADPLRRLLSRAQGLAPGDTDLTWTRLTPWRAMLASALDIHQLPVTAASVHAAKDNAAGLLLASWLGSRLGLDAEFVANAGPGITQVTLTTQEGDITLSRTDGRMATLSAPGAPTRAVALRRREMSALITEELRRLDSDQVFMTTMNHLTASQVPQGDAAKE